MHAGQSREQGARGFLDAQHQADPSTPSAAYIAVSVPAADKHAAAELLSRSHSSHNSPAQAHPVRHQPGAESPHAAGESPSVKAEQPSDAPEMQGANPMSPVMVAQPPPAVLNTAVRQVVAQLAVSVALPHEGDSSPQLQSPTQQGSLEQPSRSHSRDPQLPGSSFELIEAIKLSLSQEFLSGHLSGLPGPSDHEADAEHPSIAEGPSREQSGSSSEMKEAIRMSLSEEFLPQAEAETPPEAEPDPSCSQQQSNQDPRLLSHPCSTSSSPLSNSLSVSHASDMREDAGRFHNEEESKPAGHPYVGSPTTSPLVPHATTSPGAVRSGQDPSSPATDGTCHASGQAADGPLTGHLDTAPAASDSELVSPNIPTAQAEPQAFATALDPGQSTHSPTSNLGHGYISLPGHTPPAPIHTSAPPKPPEPSPGTAAQIDRDAALALKLQELELGDNTEAATATAETAGQEADDEVDLSALQDVEVPLVGDQLPLAALVEDYEGSPRVCGNLVPLMQRFPYFRRIRG